MEQVKEAQKEVIYTDVEAYDLELKNQTAKIKVFKEILNIVAEVIDIEQIDIQQLEEHRISYAIELFYNTNKKKLPTVITPAKALQLTSFDGSAVFKLFQQYDSIKIYKPLKIDKKSIELSVKQSDYDWFLNQDKKEQYNAVLELIEISEKLAQVGFYVNVANFMRATTSNVIRMNGLTLFPNYSYFKE